MLYLIPDDQFSLDDISNQTLDKTGAIILNVDWHSIAQMLIAMEFSPAVAYIQEALETRITERYFIPFFNALNKYTNVNLSYTSIRQTPYLYSTQDSILLIPEDIDPDVTLNLSELPFKLVIL